MRNELASFAITYYYAKELLETIWYAMRVYYENRSCWNGLISRGMQQNFSWEASAGEYQKLYEKLTAY